MRRMRARDKADLKVWTFDAPLIEIDHYGERLTGCIECNTWRGSKIAFVKELSASAIISHRDGNVYRMAFCATKWLISANFWRRGWDSNPRYGYPYNGFRVL